MGWDINQVYSFSKFLVRKNQGSGLKSVDFNISWSAEQQAYMSDLLGRWQARNNGKTGLNTGLIQDETVMQKIAPFTKPATIGISSGQAAKPDGFVYRLAMRINGTDCYKIKHGQIATVNKSKIDPPNIAADRYYFVEYLDYFSFLPSSVASMDLDYISTPPDVVWGYTFDGNGRQVYDPTTSTQPLWDDATITEITKRSLKSLGVSFKDSDFANFGQTNITTGD